MRLNMWKSSSIKSVLIESITLEDGTEEKQEKKCCESQKQEPQLNNKEILPIFNNFIEGRGTEP